MCGRFLFSAEQYDEFRRIVRDAQRRSGNNELNFRTLGDINPGVIAPVMVASGSKVVGDFQKWGWPGLRGGTIINARAETVTQKPLFAKSIAAQRCVIPACAFYEWDAARHKYLFKLPGQPLYLAGIYDNIDDVDCFVILTTAPNASVSDIHDRMPLMLAREQIRPWLTDAEAAMNILVMVPPLLKRTSCDGQISMWD